MTVSFLCLKIDVTNDMTKLYDTAIYFILSTLDEIFLFSGYKLHTVVQTTLSIL